MRKMFLMLFIALLAMSFAACGGDDPVGGDNYLEQNGYVLAEYSAGPSWGIEPGTKLPYFGAKVVGTDVEFAVAPALGYGTTGNGPLNWGHFEAQTGADWILGLDGAGVLAMANLDVLLLGEVANVAAVKVVHAWGNAVRLTAHATLTGVWTVSIPKADLTDTGWGQADSINTKVCICAEVYDNGDPWYSTPGGGENARIKYGSLPGFLSAFEVAGTNPTDGATGVNPIGNLTVNFNADITAAGTVVLTKDSDASVVPAAVTFAGSTLTVNPTADLEDSTAYTLTVTGSQGAGFTLATPEVIGFTTGIKPAFITTLILTNCPEGTMSAQAAGWGGLVPYTNAADASHNLIFQGTVDTTGANGGNPVGEWKSTTLQGATTAALANFIDATTQITFTFATPFPIALNTSVDLRVGVDRNDNGAMDWAAEIISVDNDFQIASGTVNTLIYDVANQTITGETR